MCRVAVQLWSDAPPHQIQHLRFKREPPSVVCVPRAKPEGQPSRGGTGQSDVNHVGCTSSKRIAEPPSIRSPFFVYAVTEVAGKRPLKAGDVRSLALCRDEEREFVPAARP